jgi:hypothetical protein
VEEAEAGARRRRQWRRTMWRQGVFNSGGVKESEMGVGGEA